MNDNECSLMVQEGAQLIHNTKLYKVSPSHGCPLLLEQEQSLAGPPGCAVGLSGAIKPHPVPKMLNHISKLWSLTVYQELSLYQTWMVAKRIILRNIPDIKGMVVRNV